jgi:hypothetical protein
MQPRDRVYSTLFFRKCESQTDLSSINLDYFWTRTYLGAVASDNLAQSFLYQWYDNNGNLKNLGFGTALTQNYHMDGLVKHTGSK